MSHELVVELERVSSDTRERTGSSSGLAGADRQPLREISSGSGRETIEPAPQGDGRRPCRAARSSRRRPRARSTRESIEPHTHAAVVRARELEHRQAAAR